MEDGERLSLEQIRGDCRKQADKLWINTNSKPMVEEELRSSFETRR
jgi:hypothetical protein